MENLENIQKPEQPIIVPEADTFNPQAAEKLRTTEILKDKFGKYGEAVSGAASKAIEKGVSQKEIIAQTSHEYNNGDTYE